MILSKMCYDRKLINLLIKEFWYSCSLSRVSEFKPEKLIEEPKLKLCMNEILNQIISRYVLTKNTCAFQTRVAHNWIIVDIFLIYV